MTVVLVFNSCKQAPGKKSVRIACNLPLTGYFATYGAAVRDGALMAVSEIPAPPVALDFDWQDNAGEPKTTVSIMQKQYLEPVDIYVSGVKPQTMAIMDQIAARGTPHFVWIFDPFINKNSKNNFRTWVSYKIEPRVYLDYAQSIAAKRIAIAYVQLPHTLEEFDQIVIPGLKEQGVVDLIVEKYDYGKKDFKDIAVKFSQFNPDLIILNGFQAELVALVRSLRPLGLIKENNTIATYDMLDAANILAADELENIRVITPLFVSRPDREQVRSWRERFKKRYGKDPIYTHAFGYDMASIIIDAAGRVKLPAAPEQWTQALKSTNIIGITGPLKFDAEGDLITPLEVGVFRNGKLVPLNI
jgi:branched-chain amino acid transport system substrate-binding protein